MQMSLRVKGFLDSCNSCGKCKKVCPFLNDNGTPDDIISNHPQDVFLCTNCGNCTLVCPEGISPSDALFDTKYGFIHDGNIPESIKKSLESAHSFAMRGHRFPFYHYPFTDTVFWPGCGLSGISPEIVKKTTQILGKHLNKKVGVVLDCCFDPLYQMGDIDSVEKATKRIQERLKKHKVTHVITGCTNCTKVLSYYLSEIKVEHV
jgi:Fe-S oxidoreductase